MSERIMIPIPESLYQTRIEVHYNGELNRTGCVSSGQREASIKLPAPLCECEIRLIPCDAQGKPVGRGHVYEDKSLKPEPPAHTDPPAEPEEDSGECCEGSCESSEVVADAEAEVVVERPTPIETHAESDPEGYAERQRVESVKGEARVAPAPEDGEAIGPNDKVYEYVTDEEGRLDSVTDVTDEYPVEDDEEDDD